MIFTRLRVDQRRPMDFYVNAALGSTDEYGNPFEVITLIWNNTPLHHATGYHKVHGFQDAEIYRVRRTGELAVRYRKTGHARFLQEYGDSGPYIAKVPRTPQNLKRLASMYGNKLFRIRERHFDEEVKTLYEKKVANMDEDVKKFNEEHDRGLQTRYVGVSAAPTPQVLPDRPENDELSREREALQLERIQLQKDRAEIERLKGSLGTGEPKCNYSQEFLEKQPISELRRIAKQSKATITREMNAGEVVGAILDTQADNITEQVTG